VEARLLRGWRKIPLIVPRRGRSGAENEEHTLSIDRKRSDRYTMRIYQLCALCDTHTSYCIWENLAAVGLLKPGFVTARHA
jgi:hypothetical protein